MYFGQVLTVMAVFTSFIVAYDPSNCWYEDGERVCEYIPPPLPAYSFPEAMVLIIADIWTKGDEVGNTLERGK